MSEPKRYNPSGLVCTCCGKPDAEIQSIMVTHKKGRFVQWDDYARLKAEVERLTKAHSDALADFWAIHKGYFDLKAEVERLRAGSFVTAVPSEEYEKLKAEVERLRKAGDAIASALILFEMKSEEERQNRIKAWSAAKEGRPNE